MNLLDIVFGGITLFMVVRGLFRGLFKEIASTIGMVGAYWLASKYSGALAPTFEQWVEGPGLAKLVAYGVIFFGVMLLVKLVVYGIAKATKMSAPGWLDVPGGGAVGLAKALLLCCIVVTVLLVFIPDMDFVKNSKSVELLRPGAKYLQRYLPEDMKQGADPMSFLPGMSSGMGSDKDDGDKGGMTLDKESIDPGMLEKAMEMLKKIKDLKEEEKQ